MSKKIAIKIENVKKRYRLGQIGGGTLKGDLESWWAKVRKKEDPNLKIGAKVHGKNEIFMALNGVSFTVYKGERVGIIGHNGAGKSTLLKLLSRVTGPTEGEIGINGRISSMLEVGTGFNGELTGRENVYLNGAILGMTKAEVDAKIDKIIEFSECGQFIDTPVKRYSSGMYVKLAFSVAAHLDSEILIMDEVLAVGDMAFQKKCLDKMNEVSQDEGRTILYVSHNMNTIRELCNRCIVLNHGEVIFDGDVEEAINVYMGEKDTDSIVEINLEDIKRAGYLPRKSPVKMTSIKLVDKSTPLYVCNENVVFDLAFKSFNNIDNLCLRAEISRGKGTVCVGTAFAYDIDGIKANKDNVIRATMENLRLVPGRYDVIIVLYEKISGKSIDLDMLAPTFSFKVVDEGGEIDLQWNKKSWGYVKFDDIKIKRI